LTTVFVDTGAWLAFLSRDDQYHSLAVARYRELADDRARLVTSNYIVDETATRLRYGVGLKAALGFHQMVLGAVAGGRLRVAWVDEKTEAEGWRLLEQYADVPLSLTDATSAVVARSRRITEIFGFDSDFGAMGFAVQPGPRSPDRSR
jgi:predicted nucleic acid-binding protein